MKSKILRVVVILLCLIALYYLVTTLARSLASDERFGLQPSDASAVASSERRAPIRSAWPISAGARFISGA